MKKIDCTKHNLYLIFKTFGLIGAYVILLFIVSCDNEEYNDQLIKSSIHVTDRDLLFKFLNHESKHGYRFNVREQLKKLCNSKQIRQPFNNI